MATYTSNYGWTKPSGSDNVDISVLNNNLDDQDSTIHDAFLNMAPPFSESSTYAVDDIVLYGTGLYKCHTAVVTPGSWTGSTNWQVYKLSEGGSGGGGYVLPTATASRLGGVKIGSGINVEEDGTISASGGGGLALGETSSTAYRGDRGKVAYDHSQTTGNPHGTTASDVGLGNVPNVSTNDQEPTFTEASTRNNIASGEKLSVILGKIQKFFNDLKTVAFSGNASDLDYDNTDSGLSATDVQGAVDENSDEITVLIAIANKTYKGVDLTVKFASEISNFTSAWAWFQNRLDNDNMAGIHVCDYIPFTIGTENHKAKIAGIDTFHKNGQTEVGHHVDFISENCYGTIHRYNATNTNQGNATTGSPFKASELYSWLNSTVYNALPAELKAVIKEKYLYYPLRYTSGSNLTDDNNWEFGSFGKLWLPLEGEIFDTPQWSTKGYGNPYATQYPIFANDASARIKGAGPGGSRATWWTASAYSGNATTFVGVGAHGYDYNYRASTALSVPICFRLIKAA